LAEEALIFAADFTVLGAGHALVLVVGVESVIASFLANAVLVD
jgi:hypothetical protein